MGAGHDHTPKSVTRAFVLGILLNAMFVVAEVIAGFWLDSLSLLTDAGHNLADVGSLVLGLLAVGLASRRPTGNFTYGLRKSTVLASLINSVTLFLAIGALSYAAISRLRNPVLVHGEGIAAVALIGILVNTGSALLFMRDKKHDLNVRSAYMHLLADAGISGGVVVAGIVISVTGWTWFDPLVSLFVSVAILYGAWGLLRESLRLSLDGVPSEVNIQEVRSYLTSLKNVDDVHDLHIWALSTNETALTAHLVMPDSSEPVFFQDVNEELFHRFRISHATLQIENRHGQICGQRC